MSTVWTIWRAYFASSIGGLRQDAGARIAALIGLVVDIVAGLWTINALTGNLAQWQAAGQLTVTSHLWLLCLSIWAGIGAFAILAVFAQGFGDNQPVLLITLPIAPASRFRALYGLTFFAGTGNWIALSNVVIAVSLAMRLHWQALPWLLSLDMGVIVAVCISVIATLLVIRYIVPHLKRTCIVVAVAVTSFGGAFLLLKASRHAFHVTPSVQIAPALLAVFCVLLLFALLGPLAGVLGKLYQRAFYALEGRSSRRIALMLPGVRLLSAWLSRFRTYTGALLYKGLLNQSRNIFTWARAALLLLGIALFPVLQKVMLSYNFSPVAQITVYSSALAVLMVIEYAAYAISSEGARISYYLLSPFNMAVYLRARLTVFLLPALSIGLAICIILSLWHRLPIHDAGVAALLVALLLAGYTTCIVWGSAFDLDISQFAEGATQNLMLEELPVTPRRLQLLGLSTLLLAGMILLILKLPVVWSILSLTLIDVVVYVGLGRLSGAASRPMQ